MISQGLLAGVFFWFCFCCELSLAQVKMTVCLNRLVTVSDNFTFTHLMPSLQSSLPDDGLVLFP